MPPAIGEGQKGLRMSAASGFRRVPVAAIRAFIAEALGTAGLPPDDAAKCAALMGEADLTGADAHGVFRLPQYVRRLKAGGFNPRPNIAVTKSAPATALVDGDNAMGHLVMSRAAEAAIAPAISTPVGPAPTMTKFNSRARSAGSGSVSAFSKASRMRRRM